MKLLIMGPQGSGKGTIGELLSVSLNIPTISVGQVLRDLSEEDENYQEVKKTIDAGNLVSNELVANLIKNRISADDCQNGFILDGWPRNLSQVESFDPTPDKVILLSIPKEVSMQRITGRRICTSDGLSYNIYTLPKEELEKCTGELVQRPDDTEEAVEKRLNIYYEDTEKVVDFYRKEGVLLEIDAQPLPQEIADDILEQIN